MRRVKEFRAAGFSESSFPHLSFRGTFFAVDVANSYANVLARVIFRWDNCSLISGSLF